jgi:ATP-dependent Clp protease adapter protein ClpS
MDRMVATRCMFEAHTHGSAACGTYLPEVAAARAAHVLDLARARGHELRCVAT